MAVKINKYTKWEMALGTEWTQRWFLGGLEDYIIENKRSQRITEFSIWYNDEIII